MWWYPWKCPRYELGQTPMQAKPTKAKLTVWSGSEQLGVLPEKSGVLKSSSKSDLILVTVSGFCLFSFVCNLILIYAIQSTGNLFLTQFCSECRKPLLNSDTAGSFLHANHCIPGEICRSSSAECRSKRTGRLCNLPWKYTIQLGNQWLRFWRKPGGIPGPLQYLCPVVHSTSLATLVFLSSSPAAEILQAKISSVLLLQRFC